MDPAGSSSLNTSFVLKDGDSYLIADRLGDIAGDRDGQFLDDTRILSRYRLLINGSAPILLSSYVTRDNVFFVAHLTNQRLVPLGGDATGHGIVHIKRTRFLHQDAMHERLSFFNYGQTPVQLALTVEVGADFVDMFEVRGSLRARRGERLPEQRTANGLVFAYRGLDETVRRSELSFEPAPERMGTDAVDFTLPLPPGARQMLYVHVGAQAHASRATFRTSAALARRRMRRRVRTGARIRSEGPLFNAWMDRSRADLAMLTSELDTGPYPYAGVPWFSTPFGRDAVITALQTLWLDPALARGVLSFLARHQAREESSFMDAAPGKIMHETRKGEMSVLGELPFGRYYGGVDTTPLFLTLAAEYLSRTDELAFIDSIWNELAAATAWIERVCDANPLGFLDYARGEASGLANQGWKDSSDSVFHRDGRPPQGAIALVEVQGYVFSALRGMAWMAHRRGDDTAASRWLERAKRLRAGVEARYWMPERGFYGIAIDGTGALCEVDASNAGHLLYSGLASTERAMRVAEELLASRFFCGWGIRTLASDQPHYNPMSYHNGSVWPHDSALCAAGLSRYGERVAVTRLLRGAFEAAVRFDMRVPELFCGFPRVPGSSPVAYPVACLPQAWAAGSAFMLVQSCLGLAVDGASGEITLDRPHLPIGIDELVVHGLTVGEHCVDLVVKHFNGRVGGFLEGPGSARVPLRILSG